MNLSLQPLCVIVLLALSGSFALGVEVFLPSHSQPAPLQAVEAGSHSLALVLEDESGAAMPEGGWRLRGESGWRASGVAAVGLLEGSHWVEFKPATGKVTPTPREVAVPGVAQETAVYGSRTVVEGTGWLSVLAESPGGEPFWRVDGETEWRGSGSRYEAQGGVVEVEFRGFPGWWSPPPACARIIPGQGLRQRPRYHPAADPAEWGMSPIAPADLVEAPYAYLGRIDSPRGSFTGIVVDQYVVLTVLEAVFNPVTGGIVPGVTWSPVVHDGERVPAPRKAAGMILMANPEDPDFDDPGNALVAVYFGAPAADGGWCGFHQGAQWLDPGRPALTAGYVPGDGRLHASVSRPLPPVSFDGAGLFEFEGFPPAPGTPLLTRRSNGSYFPAAVCIGEHAGQARLRIIDDEVARIIRAANDRALLQDGGTGTDQLFSEGAFGGGTVLPGTVTALIEGSEAGRWQVAEGEFLATNQSLEVDAGSHEVSFTEPAGLIPPEAQSIEVEPGEEAIVEASYGQTYESYAEAMFPTGATKTGPNQDFDGDGMVNFLEWAFGRDLQVAESGVDPRSPVTSVLMPDESEEAPQLRIRFYRRKAAVAAGVVYEVQFADGLAGWQAQPVEFCEDLGPEWEWVTADDPSPGGPRRFGRVSVEEPSEP